MLMEGARYVKLQESFEKMFAQINVMNFLFSPFALSYSHPYKATVYLSVLRNKEAARHKLKSPH